MQRKAYIAMDLHKPISDTMMEKLGGVYPIKIAAAKEFTTTESGGPLKSSLGSSNFMSLQVDPEHWRSYATPVSTPTGDHDSSEHDDAIQVDIAPEEPSTELSNWESFIHGLSDTNRL